MYPMASNPRLVAGEPSVRPPIASWLSYGDDPDAVVGPFALPPLLTR
jgi:hypothetical protein